MASEDFARKFSLIPPPTGKRLRVEFAKARAAERRASRKLDEILDACATETSAAPEARTKASHVGPLQLMRAWSSPGMLNLRSGLDGQAEEQLRARLEARLAGELRRRRG
jgi:hypothetical protein